MRTRRTLHRVLLTLLVATLTMALAGCGGTANPTTAPQSSPTPRPTATPVPPTPTTVAAAEPTAAETTQMDSLLTNVSKLAPVHVVSTTTTKEGDTVTQNSKLEMDMDAAGNYHMILYTDDTVDAEIYIVDGQMYMGGGDEQFVAFPSEDMDPWAIVAAYGGAFLWVFDTMEDASLIGTETVNGFNTNKYSYQIDLSAMGLAGLLAGQEGNFLEYQGFAWVEMSAKALVKSQVKFQVQEAGDAQVTEVQTTFDAEKANIPTIQEPENVLGQ